MRPLAILGVQLLLLGFLGFQGAHMPGDNSIETFAVAGTRAEADFALLHQHFQAGERFVVAIQAREVRQAGPLLARFAQLEGIKDHVSLFSLFPEALPEALPTGLLPLKTGDFWVGYFLPENRAATARAVALGKQLEQEGLSARVVVAGEPVVNHYLDLAALEVKYRFFPLLIGCSLILLGVLFGDVRLLLVAGLAVGGSLATVTGVMALSGETMNLVTNLIPALVFVLSLAMQVHVLIAVAAEGNLDAGVRAKLKPNFLIALTTSIGFGSLMTSQVVPIATMGKYMALGMWIIFLWTHGVHFGLSKLIGLAPKMPPLHLLMDRLKGPAYGRLCRQPSLLGLCLLVIAGGVWGLWHNPTESNGLNYFPSQHPIRRDTHFLQEQITGGSMLEVLVAAPSALDPEEAYVPEDAEAFEQRLASLPGVRHVVSLSSMGSFASRCEEAGLEPALDETLLAGMTSNAFYRVQLLVDSMDRPEYMTLRQGLLAVAEEMGQSVVITGILDRVIEIQGYLLSSLLRSLALTVLAVVVLLLVLLGRKTPLLAVILPNLFPLGAMALGMVVLGIPTTISSVMVFSVAFGIAVDDTIHLLHGYLHQRQGDPQTRWAGTVDQDARAILLTTLVLCMGFAILATSSFLPTRHFGLLLSVGMVAALLGDLLFLPLCLMRRKP